MGIIRNAEKAPTNIVYKIDDMTAAPMDVRQWVDTDVSVFSRITWGSSGTLGFQLFQFNLLKDFLSVKIH